MAHDDDTGSGTTRGAAVKPVAWAVSLAGVIGRNDFYLNKTAAEIDARIGQVPLYAAPPADLPPRGQPTGGWKDYPDCQPMHSSMCLRPDCRRCDDGWPACRAVA